MAYYRAPALDVLMAEVNKLWPHRDKTSDGWIGDTSHQARPSDHNPAPPTGIVRAQDIDEDLVAGLTATGEAMPLVNAIIRDVRTRYVIYEGRIWTRENGWQPYYGVNAHRHHIHVSVRSINGYDRDRSPWNLAARMGNTVSGGGSVTRPTLPGGPLPAPPAPVDPLEQIMSYYTGRKDFEGHVKRLASEAVKETLEKATFTDTNGKVQTFGSIWRFRISKIEALLAQLLGRNPADVDEAALAKQIAASIPDTLAGQVADELATRLKG